METNAKTGRLLAVLLAGVLLGAMDIAIVGPAMPLIRGQFSLDDRDLSWIFTLYVLFNLVGTVLMARLSDLLGRKAVYVANVALFAMGSVMVAWAPSYAFLLAARALQGLAAGGFMPVASAVIGDVFPAEKRGGALGMIGMVFGLAFIIGPVVGGLVLPLGWRWLFWVNLPLAAAVGAAALALLPGKKAGAGARFDLPGMALVAVVLAAFAYGVNRIDTSHFFASLVSGSSGAFILGALVLGVPLVLMERRNPLPAVPVGLIRGRRMIVASLVNVGAGAAESSLIYVAQLAVAAFGATPAQGSFLMMPLVLGMTVGSPVAGRLLDSRGPRTVIGAGAALMAAGMAMLGLSGSSMFLFIAGQSLVGIGLSAMLGAPIRYIFLEEARPEDRSAAQGLVNLESSAGMLLGGAAIGAVAASSGGGASGIRTAYLVLAALSVLIFAAAPALGRKTGLAGAAGGSTGA